MTDCRKVAHPCVQYELLVFRVIAFKSLVGGMPPNLFSTVVEALSFTSSRGSGAAVAFCEIEK